MEATTCTHSVTLDEDQKQGLFEKAHELVRDLQGRSRKDGRPEAGKLEHAARYNGAASAGLPKRENGSDAPCEQSHQTGDCHDEAQGTMRRSKSTSRKESSEKVRREDLSIVLLSGRAMKRTLPKTCLDWRSWVILTCTLV